MKVRQGFVSNSSSSAFILPADSLTGKDIANLKMAFDTVLLNDDREIIVTYTCGSDLAVKIINSLIKIAPYKRSNVS